jgi:ERCC4-type nuclease
MTDEQRTITIKVDTREKNTGVVKFWNERPSQFPGLSIEFMEMDHGDYVIGNSTVIERKSTTDFMLSVMDKHLLDNLTALKKTFEQVIYIVEGDFYAPRFHSDPAKLQQAIAYMTVKENSPLVPSPGPQSTAELIYAMALQCN